MVRGGPCESKAGFYLDTLGFFFGGEVSVGIEGGHFEACS